MKNKIMILSIILFTQHLYGQSSIQTKEISIPYSNGYEVFKVCSSGCSTKFDDKKEYFWYTEFSKVKSTKGGSGGSLLHGNYKFYDKNGNLREDKNYYLGLSDGIEKNWDSLGNIISQFKYNKGETIYMKFQNDKNYWIELNGPIFKEGTVRKVYSQTNILLSEETMLDDFKQRYRTYYEYSGKLKEDFTSSALGREYLIGKYTCYFENGNIEVEGQYYDGDFLSLRVGTWKWYNSDGTLLATEEYRHTIIMWPNGKLKCVGGFVFNVQTNEWLKNGEWRWYDEDGTYRTSKTYRLGVEVND